MLEDDGLRSGVCDHRSAGSRSGAVPMAASTSSATVKSTQASRPTGSRPAKSSPLKFQSAVKASFLAHNPPLTLQLLASEAARLSQSAGARAGRADAMASTQTEGSAETSRDSVNRAGTP